MTTICLSMIVRNESKTIKRCLDSVKHLIDYFVIVDTGSTDETIQIINDWTRKNKIHGHVLSREWKNFEYNRNEALNLTKLYSFPIDYILFCDADMEFVNKRFNKESLRYDAYYIKQRNQNLEYSNIRLISTKFNWKYKGVTHEYLYEASYTVKPHRLETCYFIDHTDGGCKSDKFERDIKLLSKVVKENPDDARSWFYLGNSYFDVKDYRKAFECYNKRISLNGWEEEVFYSKYKRALCLKNYKENEWEDCEVINWFYEMLQTYESRPSRLEPLYELLKFCIETERYELGFALCKNKEKLPYPTDLLFVDKEIHEWRFLALLAHCTLKTGRVEYAQELENKLHSEKKYFIK